MKSGQNKHEFSYYMPAPFNTAVCITFDFETSAQTPVPSAYTRIKSKGFSITNAARLTNLDISSIYGRGYGNRIGAEMALKIFNMYSIKATWFSTGHVLMKENKNREKFRINQILPYALAEAGFTSATTWRATHKSFYHEPFSSYQKKPFYYLGDLADELNRQGQDIQCHSFSHPYISMESPENIKTDLDDWQNLAEKEGFKKSKIFAFPFLGDYHFTEQRNGLKTIPAFRKPGLEYKASYLDNNVLQIFNKAGFELFTRCGSMHNSELIRGFIPYRNSEIYCMKDIGLLSFTNIADFKKFLEEVIRNNACVDLWLHPNDILANDKFNLFNLFIDELVQLRDKGKILLSPVSELWERFKKEKLKDPR